MQITRLSLEDKNYKNNTACDFTVISRCCKVKGTPCNAVKHMVK